MLLGLVVIAGAFAASLFGVWGFNQTAIGAHVTECRFDAQGAYAKVPGNNLLRSSDHEKVV